MTTTDQRVNAPQRIPALDGIRGLAVILVVIHNAGSVDGDFGGIGLKAWAVLSNAGWIGVQMFFALSGFLITRILLESKGGAGYYGHFYARRALRIVPLYYLLLALVFFVAPHVPALAVLESGQTRSTLWFWSYLSDWIAPFGGLAIGLAHVWSLAVEEQFYLVWPVLVALADDATIVVACVGLAVSAAVARAVLHTVLTDDVASSAAYAFTVARWDAIALGALIAVALRHDWLWLLIRRRAALITAIALVLLAWVLGTEHGIAPAGGVAEHINVPVTAVLSALVVFACVDAAVSGAPSRLTRLFSARWMAWVGKYSYAIYVFHLPVHLVLHPFAARVLLPGDASVRLLELGAYTASVFVISTALAFVSWRYFEAPMLALKRHVPMPAPPTQPQAARANALE